MNDGDRGSFKDQRILCNLRDQSNRDFNFKKPNHISRISIAASIYYLSSSGQISYHSSPPLSDSILSICQIVKNAFKDTNFSRHILSSRYIIGYLDADEGK